MSMLRLLKQVAVIALLGATSVANAAIGITFDAQSATGTSVSLASGTYTGKWTGGGWSAWSSGDHWLNSFSIRTTSNTFGFGTGAFPYYASPTAALNAVEGMTFSFFVPTQQNVQFTVADNLFGDNRGSLSLSIAPVPEPGTYAMLLAGLGLVGVAARKKKPLRS